MHRESSLSEKRFEGMVSLSELISMLEVQLQIAQNFIDKNPGDEGLAFMAKLSGNSLFYLRLFKDSLGAIENLRDSITAMNLRQMPPTQKMQ